MAYPYKALRTYTGTVTNFATARSLAIWLLGKRVNEFIFIKTDEGPNAKCEINARIIVLNDTEVSAIEQQLEST